MGIQQALTTSLSGIAVTQASLSVVAGNIANAQTPGYVAQVATQISTVAGGNSGDSVRTVAVNRTLDQFVQQQLWTESAGGGYADLMSNFYDQLQPVYGQPGSTTSLDSVFNNFTSAVQSLSTSPDSPAAQSQTIAAAQAFAQALNGATASIQGLRTLADEGIANDVQQANNALQQIANINQQIAAGTQNDSAAATLENQRDQYVSQLSKLMDVRVATNDKNQVSVFTNSGQQLCSATQASTLAFNATGSVTPNEQWNADPTKSSLGTISLITPSGSSIDLVGQGAIRSGEIAGYLNMRDNVLVQAQTQVDQMATQMSSALSDTTTNGSAVSVGATAGFDVDLSSLSAGNTVNLSYTDTSNVQHNIEIVRVNDPSALPLPNTATNPNDTVIGVDFSGGISSVVSQLNTAFNAAGLNFSNPTGSTLRVLNVTPNPVTIDSASTTTTATSLTSGSPALPLFTDGGTPFTNATTSGGNESVGYAGRITVNPALVADSSLLQTYNLSPATPSGDATRANFIYNQLTGTPLTYSPSTGLGSATSPFQGTLSSFISQMVSTQSISASAATNLKQGQDVVVNSLQSRFNTTSSVNIDTEMANLLQLQNTYQANARVMSTAKAMLDALMQVM
jgi:flagellar hook-associated protein 1 FlgK